MIRHRASNGVEGEGDRVAPRTAVEAIRVMMSPRYATLLSVPRHCPFRVCDTNGTAFRALPINKEFNISEIIVVINCRRIMAKKQNGNFLC